jgi:hypothetical protein
VRRAGWLCMCVPGVFVCVGGGPWHARQRTRELEARVRCVAARGASVFASAGSEARAPKLRVPCAAQRDDVCMYLQTAGTAPADRSERASARARCYHVPTWGGVRCLVGCRLGLVCVGSVRPGQLQRVVAFGRRHSA